MNKQKVFFPGESEFFTSFNEIFHLKFSQAVPVRYCHCAASSVQPLEETSHTFLYGMELDESPNPFRGRLSRVMLCASTLQSLQFFLPCTTALYREFPLFLYSNPPSNPFKYSRKLHRNRIFTL